MSLNKGDIVLVIFPFSDLSQTKLRPALVLAASKTIDEITLCFIPSQNPNSLSVDEFAIAKSDNEFAQTGLKTDSKVRVTKIITLERKLILRKIGKLSHKQTEKLNQTLTVKVDSVCNILVIATFVCESYFDFNSFW